MTKEMIYELLKGFSGCGLLIVGFVVLTPERLIGRDGLDWFLFGGGLYILATGKILAFSSLVNLWSVAFAGQTRKQRKR